MTDEITQQFPSHSTFALTIHPSDTPQERDELAGILSNLVSENNKTSWYRSLRFFQNTAFLVGQAYTLWNWNGQTLSTTSPRSGINSAATIIPNTVANELIRPFEATVSMFSSQKPVPKISPRSDDPVDEDAAILAETALSVVWEDPLRMQSKIRELASSLALTGTAAMEVVLEDQGAYNVPVPKMKEEEVEDELLGTILKEVEVVGEEDYKSYSQLRCTVYDAFQLIQDPKADSDPDKMSFLGVQMYCDKGWVQTAYNKDEPGYYPENLDNLAESDGTSSPLYWRDRIKDLIDSPDETGMSTPGRDRVNSQDVVLRIFDVKPNTYYPKGRTIVFAGGQLIYCSPKDVGGRVWNPKYPEIWTPLTIFRYWSIPGRFFGMPLLNPLVPLQKRINAIDSLVQQNRELMTIGTWLVPNTAGIPDGYISGIPGQTITYKIRGGVAAKPERVENQPLPAELLIERDLHVASIQRISGMNEILSGSNPPPNVRSGSMMNFMRSQALQSKAAMFQDFEEGLQEVARNILIAIASGLDDPNHPLSQRITMAARNHASLAIENFRGADLRDNTIVSFDIASAILKEPAALEQKAIELLQYAGGMGLI